jgi:hypothetical protein
MVKLKNGQIVKDSWDQLNGKKRLASGLMSHESKQTKILCVHCVICGKNRVSSLGFRVSSITC